MTEIKVGDTVQWKHRFLCNSQRLRSGTVIELNGVSMLTVQPKNKRTRPALVHRSQLVTLTPKLRTGEPGGPEKAQP